MPLLISLCSFFVNTLFMSRLLMFISLPVSLNFWGRAFLFSLYRSSGRVGSFGGVAYDYLMLVFLCTRYLILIPVSYTHLGAGGRKGVVPYTGIQAAVREKDLIADGEAACPFLSCCLLYTSVILHLDREYQVQGLLVSYL